MTAGATSNAKPATRLAAGFAPATRADWLALVDKAIKGADFEKKLVSRTADGLRIEPIYTPADALGGAATAMPGAAPFTRGTSAAVKGLGWEIHQRVDAGDPKAANATILEELEGGANGIVVVVAGPGQAGTRMAAPADVETILKGVDLELAPVQLSAGLAAAPAARHLLAALPALGFAPGKARGFLNLDPIGTLARFGTLDAPLEQALAEAMALAKEARAREPGLRTARADATVYHEAGASEGQELALLAATFVAYLRTFEAAGIAPADALTHLSFAVAADADQFLSVAKLRAARRLIWRIAEASGAGPRAASGLHITAATSRRMMARRDPWTNLLRTTLACAGAALGGADAITVEPFTAPLGEPDAFARRIARNIQIVLQEESALGRVVDPTGGSWYVEKLTDDLARTAWDLFQGIEAKGGIIAALGSGVVQKEIAAMREARAATVASGRIPLTGVSTFPRLGDDGVAVTPRPAPPPVTGKTLIEPLLPCRSAEPFEALRDAADAFAARSGKPPQVFLASLGAVIDHTARSTWTENYLAAGGIAALAGDGYRHAAEAARAFKASGARAACICASDQVNAEHAEATAKALKAAGATWVLMAARPGEREAALTAAGVDQFLTAGTDAVKTLRALQEKLGA